MNQEKYPVRDKYCIYQEITQNSSRTVQGKKGKKGTLITQ